MLSRYSKLNLNTYLQIEDTFRSHIEKKVEHTQIGLEAVFALVHLIIAAGSEVWVSLGMFGGDDITEVMRTGHHRLAEVGCARPGYSLIGQLAVGYIDRRGTEVWTEVKKGTHRAAYLQIEVIEIVPLALKEGAQVVSIILEERRLTVGTQQGVPMEMAPIAVIADADIAHQSRLAPRHRHRERLEPIGGGDDTTVTVSLFAVSLRSIHDRP